MHKDSRHIRSSCPHGIWHQIASCSSFSVAPIRHYFPEREPVGSAGQSVQTGLGQWPSWESHPSRDLRLPPPLRCLWLDGSIMIGCFDLGGTIHHGSFSGQTLSLRTFDAIVFTDGSDLPAGGLGVFSDAAFAYRAKQLTYLNCWI